MKKRKIPIFLELTLGSLIIIIVILGIYSVIQMVSFSIFSHRYENKYLISRYDEVSALAQYTDTKASTVSFYGYLDKVTNDHNNEYIRIYSNEKVDYMTTSEIWNKIEYNYSVNDIGIDIKIIRFDLYKVLSAPIIINNDEYTIQIVQEMDMLDEFIESYLPTLILMGIVGIILSIVGSMYVSKSFLKRLRSLSNTMNEIKDKGIKQRAEVSELNDEFDKVNQVFNSMMDEVEEAFDEQSRFVSDASHELKTPLTALQGHLSMLKRWGKNDKERLEKSLDICLSEVDRLKKIVNDMLILSKMEKIAMDLENIEHIDPSIVINNVIEQYKILNINTKYNIYIEDNLKIKILESDLKQLLIIFIDNAIKYNDKDKLEIDITFSTINDKFILSVKDNGIGIPKEDIDNVTKRLYKVDKSRVNNNSFGIGLSIADRIIKNYNGNISISSEVGKYTEISVII